MIIHNDFHRTCTHITLPPSGRITTRTVQHIRHTLCGIAGCICEQDPLCAQGPQNYEIVEQHDDGSITLEETC